MTCEQVRALRHAYADGEVDALRAIEIEEHLQGCADCFRDCDHIRTLRSALRSDALYFRAPAPFKRQVRAALRGSGGTTGVSWPFSWAWLKLAIPAGVTAFAAVVLMLTLSRLPMDDGLPQEILSSHVRSLMPGHLTDVASSDHHTVKPWFAGKLDFSPRVVDLAERGFPLVGGRLDYVENRPVAALVYQRRKHLINVFMWPDVRGQAAGPGRVATRQGYNLVHWTQVGMNYWAASDLNARELLDFVHIMQSAR